MRGQQHSDPSRRARTQFIAQQIASLGGPVGESDRRQLDTLAGRVVVIGDPRPGRIGGHERIQQRRCERRQLTHSGSLEPAVRIGDGAGAESVESVDPAAAGSTVASVGSLPSRPEPAPV